MRESGEMYLETILILTNQQNSVRSIDIAEYMNYSKPSINRAVNTLKKDGYIIIDEHGNIALTKNGLTVDRNIEDVFFRLLQNALRRNIFPCKELIQRNIQLFA